MLTCLYSQSVAIILKQTQRPPPSRHKGQEQAFQSPTADGSLSLLITTSGLPLSKIDTLMLPRGVIKIKQHFKSLAKEGLKKWLTVIMQMAIESPEWPFFVLVRLHN